VDRGAADRRHIVERLGEQRPEILLAARDRGETRLAGRPLRRVDVQHRQRVLVDLGLHGRRRELVGKLQLDRLEAGSGGSADALDQRVFDVEVAEIGRETRHGGLSMVR
jgi:hypothetical protein